MSIEKLLAVSNFYGKNPEFVLAGGGNTSFKDEQFMYIKGSGTTLGTITAEGFVKMNRAKLGAMWTKAYSADPDERESAVLQDLMDAREPSELAKRPSVETSLHDMFPFKYVVHTHPALINGMTCGRNGEAEAKAMFGDDVIWIPSTNPGWILAQDVKAKMTAYKAKTGREAQMVILQNHGIFFAADTTEEIDGMTSRVVKQFEDKLLRKPDFSPVRFDSQKAAALAPAIRMLLWDDGAVVTFRANAEYQRRLENQQTFEPLSSAYSPDQIVYCGHEALWVPSCDDMEAQYQALTDALKQYRARTQRMPRVVAVQGLGVFTKGNTKKAADIAADMFLDVAKIAAYAESFGGHLFMTKPFIDFILNWEVESYRAKLSLAAAAQKRLMNKISIVTGSAQGFGAGIAEEMMREGSYMVVADLNAELAATNAKFWSEQYGAGSAVACTVDVTKEESVEAMFINTMLCYGGLDVFVNNAGIVKAGGLNEMDLKTFELVTKVNYDAYFLGAKYAAKYMAIQHRFAPGYFMDIIQINSKSGLTGSNKNFAYAGSKFGGIGLTQSFALELVEYNIKVNSVCPGNYYGGPLWNDPEKGLFVQYLNSGKVPGAKSIDDVKKFYMDKTPIRRGCEPYDVAKAVFYCVEQCYETGQAIPVTGGQNMLK